jgi:Kdo2-lipid IVA lauroyltransferase/acyltransferase
VASPTALSEKAAPGRSPARRWYFHGFNTSLSWKLIERITPRLPRVVLAPLHHLTSLVFFAAMPRERAAVRRNLRQVTGRRGLSNLRLAYRLFWNFSRFLVAYTEMKNLDPDRFRDHLLPVEESHDCMDRLVQEGKGAIIVTMHLGHWDMGLKLLTARHQLPVHVVMLTEDPEEVTRYADEARADPQIRVHQSGEDPLLGVELMLALKRGELVALQADRPVGRYVRRVPFFGAAAPLPAGPVQLAMATGAPLVPAFVLLDRGGRFQVRLLPAMYFSRAAAGGEEQALREGLLRVAKMMESAVARNPDQWFNFYDVWPEERLSGGGRSGA